MRRRRFVDCALLLATAALIPRAAGAQTSPQPRPLASPRPPSAQSTEPQWEILFQGGFVLASGTPAGESHTPFAGPTFVMADGATPSRFVASWYYADGAELLNQVLGLRGSPVRMSALNRPPGWPVVGRSGNEVGGGIARHLKRGLWFEATVDFGLDGLSFDDATRERVEAVRASFETAFNALAASAPSLITSSTVASDAELAAGGRRLLVSALFQYRGPERPIRPIFSGGFGISSAFGSPATLTLTGRYRFTTPSQAVIEETDTMRLRYEASSSLVWIFGGGFMHDVTRSSAYRVEFRVRTSSRKLTAHLDSAPSRVTTSPGGVLVLNATSPGIQFSSSPTVTPSLSLTPVTFEALTGKGRVFQLILSAAYVRRF